MCREVAFIPFSCFSTFIKLCSFVVLTACGGGGEGENPTTQTLRFEENELVKIINVDEPTFSNTLSGLKSTGLLTYTSSEESVASVDQAGVITLVGEGETTITVQSEGDENYLAASASFLLRIEKARLNQPQLSAITGIKKITLRWQQVEGAHHYNLFRCNTNCEKLPLDIEAKPESDTIEILQEISANDNAVPHTYRVQACDEGETQCSRQSDPLVVAANATVGHFKAPLEYLSEEALFGVSMAISATGELVISAPDEIIDEAENIKGAVYVYDNHNSGQWELKSRITNPIPDSEFGLSVDIHFLGYQLVVSGVGSNQAGFVRLMGHVYSRSSEGIWNYDTTLTLDTQSTQIGRSSNVAISATGNVIISSAWGKRSAALFHHSEDGWQQEWADKGEAGSDKPTFTDIAISNDGDTFAIADEDDEQLTLNIYRRDNNGAWVGEHEIIKPVSALNQSKIALIDNGMQLAVSVSSESRGDGDSAKPGVGAVYLYRQTEEGWRQTETIQPDLPAGSRFGYELALEPLDGRYLVVASDAPRLESPVFLYYFNDQSQWVALEGANITSREKSDGAHQDKYGTSIAISHGGRDIVVGAYEDDSLVQESITPLSEKIVTGESKKSGAVYLF